jgi:hypothetical protein
MKLLHELFTASLKHRQQPLDFRMWGINDMLKGMTSHSDPEVAASAKQLLSLADQYPDVSSFLSIPVARESAVFSAVPPFMSTLIGVTSLISTPVSRGSLFIYPYTNACLTPVSPVSPLEGFLRSLGMLPLLFFFWRGERLYRTRPCRDKPRQTNVTRRGKTSAGHKAT